MSIDENPKLETVETLASEASELLRDLIAECELFLEQNPMMVVQVVEPKRVKMIYPGTAIEYLVRTAKRVQWVAANCTNDQILSNLSGDLVDIERDIRAIATDLPSEVEESAKNMRRFADGGMDLVDAMLHRAGALLTAAAAFKLPAEEEVFERSDILYWARQNKLGKSENNLRSRLARNEGFVKDGALSRDGLIRFLYDLRDNTRQPRAP